LTTAYLGIDVGTTAVKAILAGEAGDVLAEADAPLQVSVPRPGWSEQEPAGWWTASVQATRAALSRTGRPAGGRVGVPGRDARRHGRGASGPSAGARGGRAGARIEIAAIGLSGQMHSLVALDADHEVIRPAILWNDVRTTAQCRAIEERVGQAGLRRLVGNPALEGFTATKVLWLRDNEPDSYRRLHTLLLAKDYVRYRLTGELATEPSDAAATLLFDIRKGRWSAEMLAALELSPSILPPVVGSGEAAGRLAPAAAKELGLRPGVPVAGGAADNPAGALGAGVVEPGTLVSSIGTSGTIVAPTAEPRVDPAMRIHAMNHAVPTTWYLMGVVLSAGAALAWLRRSLAGPGAALPGYDSLLQEAAATRPGADGLTFLPYLTGERTPHADAHARGVFFGLHAAHGRGHLVRAVVEGVTFALRDSLELVRGLGVKPTEAVAVGGGARSEFWRQMQADVFGVPIVTVGPGTGAAYGAAMLGAVAAGQFDHASHAVKAWLRPVTRQYPDAAAAAQYAEAYSRYRQLYPRLKRFFADHVP
jgi:xylulokinase